MRAAWHIVEPKEEFIDGWHIQAICEHLEAVAKGKIRNLLINVPPRHTKSTLTSVLFPAWVWIDNPWKKWLCASYAESLSVRDSVKCRRLIESVWYKEFFQVQWALTSDQNQKSRYDTTAQGYRIATSVGGSATGEGGDFILIDDPHKATDVHSDAERLFVLRWWDEEMSSRVNDPKTSAKIVIMQRLHEDDLSGHLLGKGGWEHLCLPGEHDGEKRTTSIGWSDPRTEERELLWPDRFGRKEMDLLHLDLGSTAYAGQINQVPSPAKGNVVQKEWWRFYRDLPELDLIIQSWDLSFDATDNSSYVVGQTWGRRGSSKYLMAQYRQRVRFTGQLAAVRAERSRFQRCSAILVEKKANGAALIDTLRLEIPGLIPVEPHGSKVARAESVAPSIEAGNVFLPHMDIAPWITDYLHEWHVFPNGKNDDQVDATSQALTRLNQQLQMDFAPVSMTKSSNWRT